MAYDFNYLTQIKDTTYGGTSTAEVKVQQNTSI